MKQGIIVVNAYTNSVHELNQPNRIQEELAKLGVQTKILRNSPYLFKENADFCIYLDKDKYSALLLEQRMRLFNRARAIELCDDKLLTWLSLKGFPMPRTIPSLLCYNMQAPVSEELYQEAVSLGFPLIVKECFGSLGKQVYLAKNESELKTIAEQLKPKPHLFQEFIAQSAGKDLRVIVVGGKAVASMRRVSEHDFRSNAELGGIGEPFPLDRESKELSEAVARKLNLDFCGVDLLFGKNGYLICEVNSNAFFGTIERVTKINVAKIYAEHIYGEVYH